MLYTEPLLVEISIPAPARGRTPRHKQAERGKSDFNSRPREGANFPRPSDTRDNILFQFPPPRGGERGGYRRAGPEGPFQFPPPRGGEH